MMDQTCYRSREEQLTPTPEAPSQLRATHHCRKKRNKRPPTDLSQVLISCVWSSIRIKPGPGGCGSRFALVSLLAVPCFFLIGAFFPPQGAGLRYLGLLVGIVSSLLGVILSALGLRASSRRALAIVGLTLSIVVLVLLVLLMLYLIPVTGGSHH